MQMKQVIFAFGLAMAATVAHADTWKCGSSYQDHPCQAGSTAGSKVTEKHHHHHHHHHSTQVGDTGTTPPVKNPPTTQPPATTPPPTTQPPVTQPPATQPPAPTPAPSTPPSGGTPVGIHGALAVSGNHIVDKSGQPVQLRGMSFGWSNWWGQYWTAGTVDWLIDDWKVEVIRASMGIEPSGAYLSNPSIEKNKVITVVDEAIKRGAYVIIDWHEENAPRHTAQ